MRYFYLLQRILVSRNLHTGTRKSETQTEVHGSCRYRWCIRELPFPSSVRTWQETEKAVSRKRRMGDRWVWKAGEEEDTPCLYPRRREGHCQWSWKMHYLPGCRTHSSSWRRRWVYIHFFSFYSSRYLFFLFYPTLVFMRLYVVHIYSKYEQTSSFSLLYFVFFLIFYRYIGGPSKTERIIYSLKRSEYYHHTGFNETRRKTEKWSAEIQPLLDRLSRESLRTCK